MRNPIEQLSTAAAAQEYEHSKAVAAIATSGSGLWPKKGDRPSATIHGHKVECLATYGGNGRRNHMRITWLIDGKKASKEAVELLVKFENKSQ